MAMNNIGAGGVQGFQVTSMKRARSLRTPAENDHSVVNLGAVAPVATDADSLPVTVGDTNSGEMVNPAAPAASAHEIGKDPWWVVGFSLVAASDSSYLLTYPFLIMSRLGWIAGPIILILLTALSCHNNCLFGSLHETGGKRHIRTRDLISYVYGRRWLTTTVWIVQFTVLIIFCIGTFIWAGTSLQAIYVTYSNDPTKISLPVWIAIAGACYSIFAFFVPTLHALGLYTAISLLLTMIITFISLGISIKDGMKSGVKRDYSLVGTTADKWFGALASLSIVSFAFNIPILPELQANVRPPTVRNIYKALGFEYIVGGTPVIVLVFVAYWAYGNGVSEYLLYSTSGPTWLVTVANVAAFLQVLVTIHIFALPMFEFFDSMLSKLKRRHAEGDVADDHTLRARTGEWSKHKMLLRFVTRTTFISITTLVGAMFPFFGDILELGAALIVFPLNYGLVHHMYLKVNGKTMSWYQRAWHWLIVVIAVVLTVSSVTASTRNIIVSSSSFHIFKSSN